MPEPITSEAAAFAELLALPTDAGRWVIWRTGSGDDAFTVEIEVKNGKRWHDQKRWHGQGSTLTEAVSEALKKMREASK
jgi:hypothetical protein